MGYDPNPMIKRHVFMISGLFTKDSVKSIFWEIGLR